jgi:16S rRNA processing protein RimM
VRGRDRIEIGGVARAHGILGEIVIATHDPKSQVLAKLDAIWIGDQRCAIAKARHTQRGWLVLLDGVSTRTQAEGFRGKSVEILRNEIELKPGEFLFDDLVGCEVVLADGRPWGRIAEVELGYQDRLVIHDHGIERLLPFVPECIVSVDVEAGKVVVDPPEGIPEVAIADLSRR